jgi:hypothetical protein
LLGVLPPDLARLVGAWGRLSSAVRLRILDAAGLAGDAPSGDGDLPRKGDDGDPAHGG